MLDGIFGQQYIPLPLLARQASLQRRANDIIEQEGSIDKKRKAGNLKPFERLPAETERYEPDEKRAASVDRAARGSRHITRDRQTEEVEATRGWLIKMKRLEGRIDRRLTQC